MSSLFTCKHCGKDLLTHDHAKDCPYRSHLIPRPSAKQRIESG